MIRSFRHSGLEEFFFQGRARGINPQWKKRLAVRLDRLNAATVAEDMNLPGWRFHALKGDHAGRYAINVTGNWRLIFRFEDGDAVEVDLEDYH
jgi:proteic killer suppression protein